jgi:hypothetical protein
LGFGLTADTRELRTRHRCRALPFLLARENGSVLRDFNLLVVLLVSYLPYHVLSLLHTLRDSQPQMTQIGADTNEGKCEMEELDQVEFD